jgi:hypothetical protein
MSRDHHFGGEDTGELKADDVQMPWIWPGILVFPQPCKRCWNVKITLGRLQVMESR